MTATADTICQLHRIHKQLADRKEKLSAGPQRVSAFASRLADTEQEKSVAKENVTQMKMLIDGKQLQLKSAENKDADLRSKLNVCSNNREYQATLEQIAADKMASSVLEDEILEAMDKVEQLNQVVQHVDREVANSTNLLAGAKKTVANEEASLKADIGQLESELAEAEAFLPDEIRTDYNRMVRTRLEDSMAAVEGDVCVGCYQQITPNMLSQLTLKETVICTACGRLLYLSEL